MDFEEFKVELTADLKKADELFSICSNEEMEFVPLPPLPISAVKDFLDGKRSNLYEVTLNGETYLTIQADKESALALLKMVKDADEEEFPLAMLPVQNLRAFVQGQRTNVANLRIRRNKDVQVRVKPEKVKERERAKEKEKAEKEA